MKRQITSYESVLGVKEAHQDWEMAPASIIARDSADLFYSFTLNKGSSDGVEPNDPVISGQYLVGRVERVWSTGCTVKTILDPSVTSARKSPTPMSRVSSARILHYPGRANVSSPAWSAQPLFPKAELCRPPAQANSSRSILIGTVRM